MDNKHLSKTKCYIVLMNNKHLKFSGFGLLVLFAVFPYSCKKPETKKVEETIINQQSAILVINEGNFQWGNASLDLLDLKQGKYTADVFKNANNFPLGDICQSAQLIDGKLFIVVNNSGKIEICDTSNFKVLHTVKGLRSPRYLCASGNEIYVTDLFANSISVLDRNTFVQKRTIATYGWSEDIAEFNNQVYFIDLSVDSVMLVGKDGGNAAGIKTIIGKPFDFISQESKLEVASYFGDSLIITNLLNNTAIVYPDMLPENPSKIIYNKGLQQYYLLFSKAVYVLRNGQYSIFYTDNNSNFSGMEITNGQLLLANAKDYVKKSEVQVINHEGKLITKYESGNITTSFLILKE